MIACLGETTGEQALQNMYLQMQSQSEGQRILTQKPRINTKIIDMEYLRALPEDTFGKTYIKFLEDNVIKQFF